MRRMLALLSSLCVASLVQAQTSYPMITHVTPLALQRGKTTEVTVEGQMNFFGAYKVLFDAPGLTAEVLDKPVDPKPTPVPVVRTVKLKVAVAADAALGVREIRLATSLGLSSVGQLLVVDTGVVAESGDNNSLAKANSVSVPTTIYGKIELAEDVDHFTFSAKAGETFTFELFGARLQDKIHDLQKHADPMLVLFDKQGRELAACDDFYFADPLLTHTFAEAGEYVLQVRDSKYDGDPRWVYAVSVTNTPCASHVYPSAGRPGEKIKVVPVGSAKKVQPQVELTLPKEPGSHLVQLELPGGKTNPVPIFVSPLPQVLEHEPNDTPEQAQKITLPAGINGRIDKARDVDHFAFQATKGKTIRFEVKARRFGSLFRSSLDSYLEILNSKGAPIASNDDTFGKDAGLTFVPTADGEYVLSIRDLNSKGGDSAIYYVEAEFANPDFTARCDPDKAMIGPGSSTAWFVHVVRQNGFDGPVTIEVKDLPTGVTASPLTIIPAMTQGVIVLTASVTAPREAKHVQLWAKGTVKNADGKEETLTRRVQPNQEIYSPGGGRARFDVNTQTVAVTDPSDVLKVNVTPKEIVLKPGEEIKLDVTIQRRPDFDKSVFLDIPLQHLGSIMGNPLPPGVTIVTGKSKTLLGTGSTGHIVLKAAPTAVPIERVPISVLAHVSINFVVKVSYSSEPLLITIQK